MNPCVERGNVGGQSGLNRRLMVRVNAVGAVRAAVGKVDAQVADEAVVGY